MVKIIEISAPEYDVKKTVDYEAVGKKIGSKIKEHFPNQKVILRGISQQDHKKPLDEVVDDITQHGTDRIDPEIGGKGYQTVDADIFGVEHHTDYSEKIVAKNTQKHVDENLKRGFEPRRVDLYIVYDADQMENIPYEKKGKIKKDAFRFKDPKNKHKAVKAVIRVK